MPKILPNISLRLKKLQKELKNRCFDACIIEHPVDLFYLTGVHFSTGSLLVCSRSARLFVDGRYIQSAKEKSDIPAFLLEESAMLKFLEGVETVAFDSRATSYDRFLKWRARGRGRFRLEPWPSPTRAMRVIKDEVEQRALRRSAHILWQGFEHLRKRCKVGVSEGELALEFELFCRKRGAQRISFEPIIAFGPHSALPHHRAGSAKLKKGQVVLIDIGIVVDDYCSDMTRTIFFGQVDPQMHKAYAAVYAAQRAALALCKPGVAIGSLDVAARKVLRSAGLEKYYLHSLGHGVGLEIHEFPRLKAGGEDAKVVLKPGMAITIEPGVYLEGLGGVRYEDTILITENGHENLYPLTF